MGGERGRSRILMAVLAGSLLAGFASGYVRANPPVVGHVFSDIIVNPGEITEGQVANFSVTGASIATGAVSANHLRTCILRDPGGTCIAPFSNAIIAVSDLQDNSITSGNIRDGEVQERHLQGGFDYLNTCRIVQNGFCGAGEFLAGGGCALTQLTFGADWYVNAPMAGLNGWDCQFTLSNQKASYAICCT